MRVLLTGAAPELTAGKAWKSLERAQKYRNAMWSAICRWSLHSGTSDGPKKYLASVMNAASAWRLKPGISPVRRAVPRLGAPSVHNSLVSAGC